LECCLVERFSCVLREILLAEILKGPLTVKSLSSHETRNKSDDNYLDYLADLLWTFLTEELELPILSIMNRSFY